MAVEHPMNRDGWRTGSHSTVSNNDRMTGTRDFHATMVSIDRLWALSVRIL